ncbi:MAG: hypothetical protein ABSA12_14590 [Verrucomicrobiia bacterium]|jgi:hypothetical protein
MSNRPTSTIHRPFSISHSSGERGVALVLTLSILALVTLLLIAFVTSMRVENAASKNYNELIKARELAQGAIDQAVAQIRAATPVRVPGLAMTNYVTFPGMVYQYNGTLPATLVALYSDPTLGDPTNLNSGLWITGGTNNLGEFSNNGTINVGWLYVAQDGTIGPPSAVSGGLHGPLVGRFAYWVDDEAAKININTAGTPTVPPTPDYGYSAPNEVDLSVLLDGLGAQVPNITGARSPNPFTTIEEIKRASATIAPDVFDDNRFEITTYSNDANYPGNTDDRDVFDRPRLVLSVLGTADITPGGNATNAYNRLSDANLANLLSSSASPLAFQTKYGATGLEQLIANIIGYQANLTTTWPPDDGNTPPVYLGLANTPLINEVQVRYDVTPGTVTPPTPSTVKRTVSVELYYMYNGRYTTGSEQLQVAGLPPVGGLFLTTVTIPVTPNKVFTGGIPGTVQSYSVFSPAVSDSATFTGNPLTESGTLQITYSRSGHRLNFAQTTLPRNQIFSAGPASSVYQGSQVIGDPAFNGVNNAAEWAPYTSASVASLGSINTGFSPPFDVSKVVMRAGPIQSVGELGYIHLPPDSALKNAWKYLTLQPGGLAPGGAATAGQIPDWAMLDLFTVGTGTGGRININSLVNAGAPEPTATRLVPLKALLNSLGLAGKASDVYQDGTSVRADTYGMKQTSGAGVFDTIGEICEIPSLAAGANQAANEAAIRRIANLITVRSNTFTIWVLAQSIKQPPGSTIGTYNPNLDVITGDVKAQAVVERYEKTPGVAGATPSFRLRYLRYLYN